MGSFIAVFTLYVQILLNKEWTGFENPSKELWFTSLLVLIVLTFLATLSSNLGYSRRRDHIVACASAPEDSYPQICKNGREKHFFDFLLGPYNIFFWFFFTSNALFLCFSIYIFWSLGGCLLILLVIIGMLLLFTTLLVHQIHFFKYRERSIRAENYERQLQNAQHSLIPTKNVSINVTC